MLVLRTVVLYVGDMWTCLQSLETDPTVAPGNLRCPNLIWKIQISGAHPSD